MVGNLIGINLLDLDGERRLLFKRRSFDLGRESFRRGTSRVDWDLIRPRHTADKKNPRSIFLPPSVVQGSVVRRPEPVELFPVASFQGV